MPKFQHISTTFAGASMFFLPPTFRQVCAVKPIHELIAFPS